MAKLRKTLPKEFMDMFQDHIKVWTAEDIEECKRLLSQCEPDAKQRGTYQETALYFDMPIEMFQWCVDRGSDVNATYTYGTPLFKHASRGRYEACKFLLEHGADPNALDYSEETPLFNAATSGNTDVVKLLLSYGADPCHRAAGWLRGITPLLSLLGNITVCDKVDTVEVLLDAQNKVRPLSKEELEQARESVLFACRQFNDYKSQMPDDVRQSREQNLNRLCALFDMTLPKFFVKPQGSMATVHRKHQKLWDALVPSEGCCANVQGEVIRIVGRVSYECMDNGGMNWDDDYRRMLDALIEHFCQGNCLDNDEIENARVAIQQINDADACICEDEVNCLTLYAVKWVEMNREPIPLGEVNYKR